MITIKKKSPQLAYPFWKGRPGNINLVTVKGVQRHSLSEGHRLQTLPAWGPGHLEQVPGFLYKVQAGPPASLAHHKNSMRVLQISTWKRAGVPTPPPAGERA